MSAAGSTLLENIRKAKMIRAYASIRAAYADYLRWHEDPSGNVVGITGATGEDDMPDIGQAFVDWIQDVLPELEKDYALSRPSAGRPGAAGPGGARKP